MKHIIIISAICFLGCSAQQKAAPDCNCTPQKALINEVSIHTLQTARFSKAQMIEYMRGKCLLVDSLSRDPTGQLFFHPVLICGIPGELITSDPTKKLGNKFLYYFKTSLDFIDTTYKNLGVTLPSSITSITALYDTIGHRIHTFGGSDNDSVALYWHGIKSERLDSNGRLELPERVYLTIHDSTEWSTFLPELKQWYEKRGIPLPPDIEN